MGPLAQMLLGNAPQDSFNEVRAARDVPGADQPRLAVEDRRAFAREFTRDNPVLGPLAVAALAPVEQAAKAVLSVTPEGTPGRGYLGRSGFDPQQILPSIGGAYTGVVQGLSDRGLFSR